MLVWMARLPPPSRLSPLNSDPAAIAFEMSCLFCEERELVPLSWPVPWLDLPSFEVAGPLLLLWPFKKHHSNGLHRKRKKKIRP